MTTKTLNFVASFGVCLNLTFLLLLFNFGLFSPLKCKEPTQIAKTRRKETIRSTFSAAWAAVWRRRARQSRRWRKTRRVKHASIVRLTFFYIYKLSVRKPSQQNSIWEKQLKVRKKYLEADLNGAVINDKMPQVNCVNVMAGSLETFTPNLNSLGNQTFMRPFQAYKVYFWIPQFFFFGIKIYFVRGGASFA